ncbi:MAG: hypothetical protein ACW986_00265 [Promethearchaeota archaeon]|jgi:hypothetical protein
MSKFFKIFTFTPWDSLHLDTLTEVKLLSLKSIIKKFPIVGQSFFDDLSLNVSKYQHYSWIECIKRIVGPDGEDYDTKLWNLIWGLDNERRTYQLLIQIIERKATLVALAPPELGKLFNKFKEEAILRTLSILNNPKMMKFIMVLAPKGISLAEEQQILQLTKSDKEKVNISNILRDIPNIKGQWFPEYSPRCPNCHQLITQIKGFNVGLLKFKCPYCGYQKS